jgi:hypothetical protein
MSISVAYVTMRETGAERKREPKRVRDQPLSPPSPSLSFIGKVGGRFSFPLVGLVKVHITRFWPPCTVKSKRKKYVLLPPSLAYVEIIPKLTFGSIYSSNYLSWSN